jgi:hypothetical protein
MNEFRITCDRKRQTAASFHTDLKTVNLLEKVFNNLAIKNQYLAHIIRSMEDYIRKTTNNQLFRIICEPSLGDFEIGSAQYFFGQFFVVHFNPQMSEKELRVYLAHELGHLFILAVMNNNMSPRDRIADDADIEPLSSIFGIFTMASRNHFYRSVGGNTLLNHLTWEEMESAFLALKNKRAKPKKII